MSETTAKNLMLAVGNSMMGDDAAGPMLFDLMEANPLTAGLPLTAAVHRRMWHIRCGH